MKRIHLLTATAVALLGLAACGDANDTPADDTTTVAENDAMPPPIDPTTASNPMVGGAEMYPTKTIVENAMASPIHKTLVAAVQKAGLADTLSGPGPYTVFAPTDAAFAKLPQATLDGLMQPDQKAKLASILTYHVVPGRLSSADIADKIEAGGGKAMLETVEGDPITASMKGNQIVLTGADGSMATITQSDIDQSNGVIFVIDGVLMPPM